MVRSTIRGRHKKKKRVAQKILSLQKKNFDPFQPIYHYGSQCNKKVAQKGPYLERKKKEKPRGDAPGSFGTLLGCVLQ